MSLPFSSRWLVMLVFFVQPLAFGSWLPRIPDVQLALGLGPAGLALVLLGLPCGTLLTLPFAGSLVSRIGTRGAMLIGFVYYSLAVALPAFAPTPELLFVALMLVGSSLSFVELALNVEADVVEKATVKPLMTTAHGCWSVGIMVGSLCGAGLAALNFSASWAIMLVAAVNLALGLWVAYSLPVTDHAAPVEAAPKPRSSWSLPSLPLLGICAFIFGITMTEGAMADWSAVFLREVLNESKGTAGLGYSIFAMMVATGRFGGAALKTRFGMVGAARICGILAIIGAAILMGATSTPMAMVGFGIIGLGVSVGFPLAVTAAASLGDRPASTNVATLSFVALTGFLVGPPVIGLIAEHSDMRWGLGSLLAVLLLSLCLSGNLRKKTIPAQTGVAEAA